MRYAPGLYFVLSRSNHSNKLQQEVKLSSTSAERDLYESLAEIYSIILTLDGLEKAYIKDAITESEYTETCARLLKQYKSSLSDETVANEFVDLDTFKRTWGVCRLSTYLLERHIFPCVDTGRETNCLVARMPQGNRETKDRSSCHC